LTQIFLTQLATKWRFKFPPHPTSASTLPLFGVIGLWMYGLGHGLDTRLTQVYHKKNKKKLILKFRANFFHSTVSIEE